MSDNWIKLVPVDARYIPDRARQVRAMIRFAEIAPNAEIDAEHCETVKFFDCGANFKQVRCPACGEQVAVEWWQDRMDKDSGEGFQLAAYELPCCKTKCTLNDLVYDWPQASGKFVLGAINSNIKTLKDEHKSELEDILATKLRVVYQHLWSAAGQSVADDRAGMTVFRATTFLAAGPASERRCSVTKRDN